MTRASQTMETARRRHSKAGIGALVCALMSPMLFCGFTGLALVYGFERFAEFVVPAFVVVFLTADAAVILGIACLFQTDTIRGAGVFGLVIGIFEVAGIAGAVIIAGYLVESLGKALGSGFGRM